MADKSTLREHWENIYETKTIQDVSWTQDEPQPSLDWIRGLSLNPKEMVVDCGGGRSALAEKVVESGHEQVEVFDISIRSLAQAKMELKSDEGRNAISYRVCNVLDYKPERDIAVWHDRAVFHFLTVKEEIDTYVANLKKWVPQHIIIGTFALDGPEKCSSLPVQRYDEKAIVALFHADYKLEKSVIWEHETPTKKKQLMTFVHLVHRTKG
ncbi:MAG: hypothetical protein ABR98_01490 [Cryomorphaceae bacterium BACL7 MAG-120910-bin2]|jgi:trans-aconitate methyltransferase|nr:MAG: hypothetical protein ABR98_01490 [Cryomorphaceae bacterium BACL7 MAG-120910-bin2]